MDITKQIHKEMYKVTIKQLEDKPNFNNSFACFRQRDFERF